MPIGVALTIRSKSDPVGDASKLPPISAASASAFWAVRFQIDTSAPQKLDYAICTNEQCIAQAPLTDTLIAAMKRGGKVTFTEVGRNNGDRVRGYWEGVVAQLPDGLPLALQ